MFGKVPINKWTGEHSIQKGLFNYAEFDHHSKSTNAQMKASRQTSEGADDATLSLEKGERE